MDTAPPRATFTKCGACKMSASGPDRKVQAWKVWHMYLEHLALYKQAFQTDQPPPFPNPEVTDIIVARLQEDSQ